MSFPRFVLSFLRGSSLDQLHSFVWWHASAQAQQCSSSAADVGWRFVPDAILPGHRRAPQWVLARTPTEVPVIGKIADENGKVDIIINSSCDGKVLETTVNDLKVECERAQKIRFQVRLALLPKRRTTSSTTWTLTSRRRRLPRSGTSRLWQNRSTARLEELQSRRDHHEA